MATTRYTIAATATDEARTMSKLKSARAEADRRAAVTGQPVTVTTQTGVVSYTATPTALAEKTAPAAPAAPAEVPAEAPEAPEAEVIDADAFAVMLAEVAAETDAEEVREEAEEKVAGALLPVVKRTGRATRASLGPSAVKEWELLYQKPRGVQIGRHDKQYALICETHQHLHVMRKLTDDRWLLRGGNRSWCPQCAEAAATPQEK